MRIHQSQHIQGSDYDAESGRLTIQFVNGALHQYGSVPQTVYDSFCQSGSPGSFFHSKIKGVYPSSKIMDGTTKSGRRSTRRM